MKSIFLSDLHIDNEHGEIARAFLFLIQKQIIPNGITDIFLVGDIFDLWIGEKKFFVKKYENIIKELSNLVSQGVSIHYFEGNHDLYIDKFWKSIGVKTYSGPQYFLLDNTTVRVEHGDLMDPSDKNYLRLKRFLHLNIIEKIINLFPGKFSYYCGNIFSQKSRSNSDSKREIYKNKILEKLITYSKKMYTLKPFDIHITGHIHFNFDTIFKAKSAPSESRDVRSINLGYQNTNRVLTLEENQISYSMFDISLHE